MTLQEDWDGYFQQRPDGGPWDVQNDYVPDLSVVNFIKEYNVPSTLRVLDAGCADGRNTKYLATKCEVVGLDFSKTVVDRAAKAIPEATFVHGDIRDLPFKTGSFDYLIDAGAFHVNHPRDTTLIIEEYHRVLLGVSSSKMFIRVFARREDSDEPIFHVSQGKLPVYGYTPDRFESIIEDEFHIDRRTYAPMYGAHGDGCYYYHLSRKT